MIVSSHIEMHYTLFFFETAQEHQIHCQRVLTLPFAKICGIDFGYNNNNTTTNNK